MLARVVLVGSLPFSNAEETFRVAAGSLSGYIGWIPDGEFAQRRLWTPMLPEFVYSNQPDLQETLAPPTRTVEAPPVIDGPDRPTWTVSGTSGSSQAESCGSTTCCTR